jgi:hypothetical protein
MQYFRTHDASLEEYKTKVELDTIKYYQHLYLSIAPNRRQQTTTLAKPTQEQKIVEDFEYLPIEPPVVNENNKPRKF